MNNAVVSLDAAASADGASLRLTDAPDWGYLLREYHELYRRSSAGGSKRIRTHQRAVRERLSKIIESNPPMRYEQPMLKPACAHLKRALDRGRLQRTAGVIRAVESVSDTLVWRYGYDKVPRGLGKKFAYAELLGPNGPVLSDQLILGLVLFAPKCVYPTHAHEGLTESYVCLSGAMSENDDGVYEPGSLIFNPPGRTHRITIDDREPCLLAYAWEGHSSSLSAQKFAFTRSRRGASASS